MTGNGALLLRVELTAARCRVVVQQEAAVGHGLRGGDRVREGNGWVDRIEDARIVLRDLELLDGSAGTTLTDREGGDAVLLDEVFLRHQRDFGREHFVAHALIRVQRGRGDGITLLEQGRVDGIHERRALAVARAASTTEAVDQPTVPTLVREGDGVDRPVDHTLFDRGGHAADIGLLGLGGSRTVGVGWRAQAEGVGFADERVEVRAREERAGLRRD